MSETLRRLGQRNVPSFLANALAPRLAVVRGAIAMDRYLQEADVLQIDRSRAREILREVQGDWAGSTPTEAELNTAALRISDEAYRRPGRRWS